MLVAESAMGYELVVVAGLGKTDSYATKTMREVVAGSLKKLQHAKLTTAFIVLPEAIDDDIFEVGKHISLAVNLTNYRFDKYKSTEEKKKATDIQSVTVLYSGDISKKKTKFNQGVEYGIALSQGMSLTRDLVNEPASALDPEGMVAAALAIEKQSGGSIQVEVGIVRNDKAGA